MIRICLWMFLFVVTGACTSNAPVDEQIYKREVIALSSLFDRLFDIKTDAQFTMDTKRKNGEYAFGKITYNTKERDEFLKRTKQEWLRIDDNLKNFVTEYPSSKWTDDAVFCRVIECVFVRKTSVLFGETENDTVIDFLNNYPAFVIEEWTKDSLLKAYELLFDSTVSERTSHLTDQQIIKGVLYQTVIGSLCADGRFEDAKELVASAKQKELDEYFLKLSETVIEMYKKIAADR